MWKKKTLIIAAVVFVVAVLAVVLWPGEREPEYQGRKLSEWIKVYSRAEQRASLVESLNEMGHRATGPDDVEVIRRAKAEQMEASEAVQEIGTNAVPILLKWIRYERPSWRKGIYHFFVPEAERRAWLAVQGFRILGQRGIPVPPELGVMSTDSRHPETALRAVQSLGYFGESGLPLLMGVVSSRTDFKRAALDAIGRGIRFHGISRTGEAMREATPGIIRVLDDSDSLARKGATNLLRMIAPEVLTNGVAH